MRRTLYYVIGGVVLLGLGIVAGIIAQKRMQIATIEAVEGVARDMIGLNAPLEPAPAWADWAYPGARHRKGGDTGETRIREEVVVPRDYHGVWTTPDSFEDVIQHYAKMLKLEDPASFAARHSGWGGGLYGGFGSETGPTSNTYMYDNGLDDANDSRPVRVECLARRTRSYTVTVFISRADNEPLTHIIVLYTPLTEPPSESAPGGA